MQGGFIILLFYSQLMPLVLTEAQGRPAVNSSYFSSINPADGQCLQEKYSDKSPDCSFGLLGNLYACEGKPGKVHFKMLKRKICHPCSLLRSVVNNAEMRLSELQPRHMRTSNK